jgi:hypothetical protein
MAGSIGIMLVTSSFGLEALIADIAFPIVSARSMGIAILNVLIQCSVAVEVPATALMAMRHGDELGRRMGEDG